MPVCDTCGADDKKQRIGATCDCGGEFQSIAKFERAQGEVFLQDNILLGLNACGGYVVRIAGKPTASPTSLVGVLKHIRDTRVCISSMETIDDLIRAENDATDMINECAQAIIRQCPELKR